MSKILTSLLLTSILFVNVSKAQDKNLSFRVMTPSAIKSLLGDFPKAGSKEETEDYRILLNWQNNRTMEECENAEAQHKASLVTLFSSNNGPLTTNEAKYLQKLYTVKYASIGLNIFIAKKQYKRARPYDVNPEIKPCIDLEGSTSYPSGHSTMAFAFAKLLGDQFPKKREAFLRAAEQAALNRVIGGVHHPSDIAAGKKLGLAIYNLIKNDLKK